MLSDHLKLAPLLTALGIVSCGGHALIPPPPAGSPECEDSGGWTLCSDGKWHNGEDILPQCPAGTVPAGGARRAVSRCRMACASSSSAVVGNSARSCRPRARSRPPRGRRRSRGSEGLIGSGDDRRPRDLPELLGRHDPLPERARLRLELVERHESDPPGSVAVDARLLEQQRQTPAAHAERARELGDLVEPTDREAVHREGSLPRSRAEGM
jgi:hypothetical protein